MFSIIENYEAVIIAASFYITNSKNPRLIFQ